MVLKHTQMIFRLTELFECVLQFCEVNNDIFKIFNTSKLTFKNSCNKGTLLNGH